MATKELSYEKDGGVGIITLRRPEAMNSLSYTLYMEIEDAVRNSDASALIITGEGRAFCAGDDVKQILGGTAGPPPEAIARGKKTGGLTPAADALLYTDIPIIAAVNGPAVGWGMELAIMADIRVASERAKFAELFVVRGLCCDAPGLGRLAQLVGREWAAELLFTGEVIDAQKALAIGLVSRVVPHDDLLPTALTIARKIAANPPLAVKAIKAGLRRTLDPDWRDVGSWAIARISELRKTEDSKESVRSFLEKREPKFVAVDRDTEYLLARRPTTMTWLSSVVLQSPRVTLTPLERAHHDALVEAVTDGELWKLWYTWVPPPESMAAEIERRLKLYADGTMLPFTVIDNSNARPVGMTTFMNVDAANKRVEIGSTWYRKSVQRSEVNTQSKLLMLTHAFETLDCIAVEFRTHFFNQQSRRAIERLGAKLDGILRNHQRTNNGTLRDTCVYSIIATEWPTVKAHLEWQLNRARQ